MLTDLIMPDIEAYFFYLHKDTEVAFQLLEKSPEKFHELFSEITFDVYQFENTFYIASDWSLVSVFIKINPYTKFNCRVIGKFNSLQECLYQRDILLSKTILFSDQPLLFLEIDEQCLKTKQLSQRSYCSIFRCSAARLKKIKCKVFDIYKTYEIEPFS